MGRHLHLTATYVYCEPFSKLSVPKYQCISEMGLDSTEHSSESCDPGTVSISVRTALMPKEPINSK